MHRSGLALAGAQATLDEWAQGRTPPTESDGIVTAAEAGELKLSGTWLVTLSACETGTGTARAGEGVLGLRRGFLQAGDAEPTPHAVARGGRSDGGADARFLRGRAAERKRPAGPRGGAAGLVDPPATGTRAAAAVTIAGPFILSSKGPAR